MRARALLGAAGAALTLAACGGGGGGVASTPAPTTTTTTTTDTTTPPVASTTPLPTTTTTTPVTTTTTTPTTTTTTPATTATSSPVLATTPNTTNYITAEYQRSVGVRAMNAAVAYNKGATGQGITIAFTDSGIDIDSAEFAGRISSASRDIASNRSVDDDAGHGTSVAAVALAAKNDGSIQGVAFNATALALRTDTPGSCSATDGCSHNDSNLARAVDAAVASGARIINMSLGGSAASLSLRQAFGRATRAGVIVVISAGNDGTADPDPLAQIANDATTANGLIVIAGSVGTAADANAISDFSDRAGNGASHYIAASGYRVRSFDHTGAAFLFSGTSYSAPHVSGALALILQAFPALTAAQAVNLIFSTATDAGATGVDAIYGNGIIDLTKAFQPIGSASLAGSAIAVSLDDNASLGGAMGDGGQLGSALGGAIILDGYSRAFAVDLARSISAAPVPRLLTSRLADRSRTASFGGGDRVVSFTITPPSAASPWTRLEQTSFDVMSGVPRVASGFAAGAIDARTMSGVAFGYAPETLAAVLAGRPGASFLTAGPAGDASLSQRAGAAVALTRQAGGWRFGLAGGGGHVADDRRLSLATLDRRGGDTTTLTATAAHRLGPATLTAGVSQLAEDRTVLGGEARGLGLGGATTRFASLEARAAAGGWTLLAAARTGWTEARLVPGLVSGVGTLRSSGWEAEASRDGLFGGDRVAFRVAQPLRVEHGIATLTVPVDYDYATGLAGTERRSADLAPSGREIDVEAAYGRGLLGGWIDANLYLRRDPGHIATRDDDIGAALRWSLGF